jgi:serine/alanine adding enzyme
MSEKIKDLIISEGPDKKKWDDFVYKHPSGNIFQTSLMHDVYKLTPFNDAGVVALEDKQGNMLGILLYTMIQEPGIKSFFSKRAIINGGPIIINNNVDYAKAIFTAYSKIATKKGIIYTEVRNLFDIKTDLHPAFTSENFSYVEHLTIYNNLELDEEEMKKRLHKGRLSNIKRALNKDMVIKPITAASDIISGHELIRKTYDRINLPSPHVKLFLNTAEIMKDHARIVGAFVGDKVIGCRVYLIYKDFIYDWFAAIDMEYSNYQASDLMPWVTMLWAKENNIKTYDFCGAGKPGVEYSVRDYKLKFGGKLMNFGRYRKIHRPLLFRLGEAGIKLYRYLK